MATKDELIKAVMTIKESNALNVKKAEDTLQNIKDVKEVDGAKVGEGINGLNSELPTQKEVEKEVNKDEGPMIPVDKDGVSKDGGNSDKLEAGKVEAERKKEDNGMKDVINVSSRKVEEAAEVHTELLKQLEEAAAREAGYLKKIDELKKMCESTIKAQEQDLTKQHAKEMNEIFKSILAEGESMEKSLRESAAKNAKLYNNAKKLHENSIKLNKILVEALKKAQPKKEMVRYETAAKRAMRGF